MFYLKGRKGNGDAKIKEASDEDDIGWWLNNEDDLLSPTTSRSKDCQSLDSSESMFSCVDSEDSESYCLAQEVRSEVNDNCERIELRSLIHEDIDVDLIERDAIGKQPDVTPFPAKEAAEYLNEGMLKPRRSQPMCYTPERLVRSQEYRILTPSPRYLSISQARIMPENENPRKALRCRRRLNYLIDSKQVGGYLPAYGREPATYYFDARVACNGARQIANLFERASPTSANLNTHNPAIVSDPVNFRGLPICEIGSPHAH